MPRKIKVVIGKKFNRLTIIEDLGNRQIGNSGEYRFVLVECECGNEREMNYNDVKHGHSKSCGCYNIEKIKERMTKHGHSDTRIYRIWKDMRRRCNNPNRRNYPDYGGRGIRVCDEWDDFINYYNWSMENGYNDTLTIERKDVNGHYEPDNCEWIPRKKQNSNTRRTIHFKAISPNGDIYETKNVREFARIHNLDRNEISNCLNGNRNNYKEWIFKLI